MAPAPQSFENCDGAIGIQTVGEDIQPEAPRGDGFGGTWPGEGGRGVPSFQLQRQAGTARRDDSLAACSPGGRFRRFTPRGVSFTAGRGPRGGVMVWQHADREAASPALRRAVCCAGAGPAGRCGYFSFSAYRRRQRKVPRKEARHSYFFEGGSLQLDKSCRKEAGTAAFLSASQTPKGKKSRPKERSWLPQARGKRCTGASCVRRTGAAPRAPQSGAQGAAGSEAFEV